MSDDLLTNGILVRRTVFDDKSTSGVRTEFVPLSEYFKTADDPILAARIRELEAKVESMRKALEPFAELAKHFTNAPDDGWIWRGEEPLEITVGDLRRAAKELETSHAHPPGE